MALPTEFDTRPFEVTPEVDDQGTLTPDAIERIRTMLDTAGFVVLPGYMTPEEISTGRELMARTLAGNEGERADFASETDIAYRRRDFHAVLWDETACAFLSSVLSRTGDLLRPYMSADAALLECCTMVSHPGSSHQYVHRDPDGVISGFMALDEIDRTRGGTVFVPGSHRIDSSDVFVFVRMLNTIVMGRNLLKLAKMRLGRGPTPAPGEIRSRVFSSLGDRHQPNLRAFLTGTNPYMSVRDLLPHRVVRMLTKGRSAWREFQLVGTTPAAGTLIVYHSRIFHAGPDNVSDGPRSLMNVSMASEAFDPIEWRPGYSPHSRMIGRPTLVSELTGWSHA